MQHWIGVVAILLCVPGTLAQQRDDSAAIEALLIESYVEGIYVNRDEDAVRRGFDPAFVLHVLDDGQVIQATLDMWLERLGLDGVASSSRYDHEFSSIDVTGDSAIVKMIIYEDSRHLYTDYFGLYRFADGWRVVNKIFQGNE